MIRTLLGLVVIAVWLVTMRIAVSAQNPADGWKIPATAAAEKNPFPANEAVLAAGKKVFSSKCVRCHGPAGKGDGPDADEEHKEHMDLTRAARAAENPDGVVFYKVWHGRQSPRMPAFEDQLSKEQAWAVVAYVQTLRKKN
ncbi:MAG TPA: c-type cytochrome [Vicinamibacterales bacterium]|nr:c-type cytochrome [Vicinamibacterales bacterium]